MEFFVPSPDGQALYFTTPEEFAPRAVANANRWELARTENRTADAGCRTADHRRCHFGIWFTPGLQSADPAGWDLERAHRPFRRAARGAESAGAGFQRTEHGAGFLPGWIDDCVCLASPGREGGCVGGQRRWFRRPEHLAHGRELCVPHLAGYGKVHVPLRPRWEHLDGTFARATTTSEFQVGHRGVAPDRAPDAHDPGGLRPRASCRQAGWHRGPGHPG